MAYTTNITNGKKPSSQIVILDGKNRVLDIWTDLRNKGYQAHIFIARQDGTHTHHPVGGHPQEIEDIMCNKDGDFSSRYRDGEIEEIKKLHINKGVGAVVVVRNLFTDDNNLLEAIKKINAIDKDIKVIAVGMEEELIKKIKDSGAVISDSIDYHGDLEQAIKAQIPPINTQREL